jgi:6-phosphogluconolactonase
LIWAEPFRAYPDREALANALAGAVSSALADAIARRGTAVLAVSGGSTPARFFHVLSAAAIDWARVIVTLVDERFVDASSPRSNTKMVAEMLLRDRAAAARFQPLSDGSGSPERAAVAAGAAISAWGGLDAGILGMGTDGHTASLFPGGDNLARAAAGDCPDTVMAMRAPNAGEPRLTLTMPLIAAARFLALHIEGGEKRIVLEKARDGGPAADMPIRYVLEQAGDRLQIFWAP